MIPAWVGDIKAIGFDVDGTLYKGDPRFTEWINEQLYGLVAVRVGKQVEEIIPEFNARRDKFGSTTLTLDSFGLDGEAIFQDLFDRAPLEQLVLPDLRLRELLEDLRVRYRLFIISNGTRRQVLRKLSILSVDWKIFQSLIACYDEGDVKPMPTPFLRVLDYLQLSPIEVLYIGDRVDTDIQGAKGVGMKTCLVWGKDSQADLSVGNIYALREILL